MKKSVFQKAVSLFLCAVLIAGVLPEMHLHSHAEEMAGTTELTEEQRQQVRNRTMESWYFPLSEEFYDDIMDYAGCRADQTNALDGTTNPGCIFPEHYDAPRGGESLYVNVATTQPVYAPARGYVYYAYDQHWGNVAVIENPVDASYSYYLVLGNVVPDGSIASGTYMDAGLAIGTVNGELRFTALMDASGKAEEIASDVEKALENLSWLLDSTGTGLVCVNPIDNAAHGGPIRYGFVPQQPAVEPTVPETTEPPMTEPPVTEPPVTEPPVTEPPVTEPPATEHQHDYVATVIRQPTHLTEGEVQYICACGDNYIEAIPKLPEHTFDQQVVSDAYLASAATPDSPAYYYYSCLCGEKGTETFAYGEPAGHTFSPEWTVNADYHWHADTCGHPDVTSDYGPHTWDAGVITVQPTHTSEGTKVYTCTVCGAQKSETLPASAEHVFDRQNTDAKYLKAAATCTSPAEYYYSCICGQVGTETFLYGEAKGHTFSDQWSHNEIQHWRAATCEHKDEKIQVGDHIWNPGVITTQPTATTKGVKTYTCSVCGATKTEEVEPSTHQHTFATTWQGNATYHWHPATCGHNNVSDLGEHRWNAGVVTSWPTHTTPGQKIYTCSVCGMTKTETLQQTHVYDQMNPTSANLKTQATCTSPAVYYKTCSCGAKGTETFTYGSALGHTASSTWGKDANYHWNVCSRCGAKGDLVAHTFASDGKCTVCGYSKADAHVHTSHLTRVPAKAATCTTDGNTQYYICDCGQWFTDVTCNTPITDHTSVVLPATGHVDKDNNGRCDVCKARLDNAVEYQVTEGGDATWLNTSNQGMVFRSNAEYAKFDRLEVDGATVPATGYTVSEGSTVVELSATYLGRLSLGSHTLNIVSKDGSAKTTFTIKQGATSASSGGSIWGFVLIMTVIVAIAIPVTFGVMYYRKKVYGE